MKPVLLIDFGSTYTKVTAVDLESETLLGTASSYTTVQTDVNDGLNNAIALLEQTTGKLEFAERYACSSAAGGLRMVTSGLVPELTAEAAREASLGAGAKVVKVFSYELTDEDIVEIDALKPDIVLLTGGTDGGNSECMLHNAKLLAGCERDFPVVLAGNRSCAAECQKLLAGRDVTRCDNVMPKFNQLNIEPVQQAIRTIFLKRIVQAKGLSKASELISGIMMPTPAAMLKAMQLLADGCEGEPGIGELVGVDLGGATTDVYSIAAGMPEQMNTVIKGLIEPYAKRTVEGDIGMRYGIHGILDAVGVGRVSQLSSIAVPRVSALVDELATHTDRLPDTAELEALDQALASMAVETAVTRHAGTIEQVFTPMGQAFLQAGKDLRSVRQVVVTGGALIRTKNTGEIARYSLYSAAKPMSLRPTDAQILVDRRYILASMGLLGEHYPQTALKIMKKEMERVGYSE